MRKRKRIDPVQEVIKEAARIKEESGNRTVEQVVADRGRDMEEVIRQFKEDRRLMPISNAPECNLCVDVRAKLGKPNDTYIYATRDRVRYCKCRICNHTFKFIPPRPASLAD